MKIGVFYHGLFTHGTPRELRPSAFAIVQEAMTCLQESGLADAADELHTCFNGSHEDEAYANMLVPPKAKVTMHGLNSFAENLTIVKMHEFAKTHPGWLLFYGHAKGATHDLDSNYGDISERWRHCMMANLILNWRSCVDFLNAGVEAVGCHWLTNQGHDRSQNYFAGNFFWVTSNFFATIPSMHTRERIKTSGIGAAESRYESEVYIGIGSRLPTIKDVADHSLGGCP